MVFGAIMAVAGTALSIYGQRKQASSERKASDENARLAEAQARDAEKRGFEAESDVRLMGRRTIGAQRTGFAGQNVQLDSGSALEVQLDTIAQAERDALTERANALREAWGYRVQRDQYGAQGRAISRSARLRTGSTLITGGAQAYDAWQRSR